MRQSLYLYVNPPAEEPQISNPTSEPVRTDIWYNDPAHQHTVAIFVNNFVGRVYIEATLKVSPTEADWFPIMLGDQPFLQVPLCGYTASTYNGHTGAFSFNFPGRFVWMRARIERGWRPCGFVDRILLNF